MSMALDRFWSKVDKTGGCWIWRAAKNQKGYGYFNYGGRIVRVHRLSYSLAKGPIPDGLTIDHLCGVRECVNPDHLEAVTNRENLLRGRGLAGTNARKTHCKRGHPFDEANTINLPTGWRECRACRVAKDKARGWRRPSVP